MLSKGKFGILLAVVMLLALILVACQPAAPEVVTEVVEVTRMVTETVVQEGETVEVTRVVTEVQEVVVEVPAEADMVEEAAMVHAASDPETLVFMTFGDPDTLDPALAYETAGGGLMRQVYEALVTFDGNDSTSFVPALATEVPSLDNGGISEDGLTYTFNIREGVTFHEGGELTPGDVAYSFQRGLLQSDPNGPQWLLLEPILGYASGDVTEEIAEGEYAGDREALIANASPEELVALCEKVKASVVSDDAAGTVTFNLAQPWGPLMATLPESWGYILDMEWVAEQGGWDGDCATWQNWYAPGSENSELTPITNGTGPYKLDHWTPGEEWVITAYENYWRTDDDPVWEGGPAGQPAIKTVIMRVVNEWGTRFAALQAGDAAYVTVPAANRSQADEFVGEFCDWKTLECTENPDNPDGQLSKWGNLAGVSRSHLFPSFNTGPDSPYIGSGQLDGNGIPPEFFSDVHMRKALGYCMDFDTMLSDAYNGDGVQNNGPILQEMLGYNYDGPQYELDLDQCAAEIEQAWDGQLPETGFRFSVLFNTGNVARQTAATILQANMASINPLYQVDVVGVPWPTYLRSFRTGQIPVAISAWIEDIHDPHNWVVPFTFGTYAGRQQMPDDLKAQFEEFATAGVSASSDAEREQIYAEMQQLFYDEALSIPLHQLNPSQYNQRYVDGYVYYSGLANNYPRFYAMSQE